MSARADERRKLERLCRYVSRPAVSEKRLSLTPSGHIRYQLKTPYSDGTTHVIFEPLDIMYRMYGMSRAHGCAGATIARLAALVPKPRVNLTRFHGVFAPNSKYRVDVTLVKRGKRRKRRADKENEEITPEQRHQAMTWAQRLKRVFKLPLLLTPLTYIHVGHIDVSVCPTCGGAAKVIASTEDQAVIDKILAHLMKKGALSPPPSCCRQRGPHPIQAGLHSAGFSHFSARHSNRRTGCLAACCLNQAGRSASQWKQMDSARNPGD